MKEIDIQNLNNTIDEFEKTVSALRLIREASGETTKAALSAKQLSAKMETQLQEMQGLHDKLAIAVNAVKDSNKETAGDIRRNNESLKSSVKNDCSDMIIEVAQNNDALVSAVTKGTAQMVTDIKETNAALTHDMIQVTEKANHTLEAIEDEARKSAEGQQKLGKRVDESLDTIESRVRENSRLVESGLDQLYTHSTSAKKEILDSVEKLDRKNQHDLDIRFKAVADLKEENAKLKADVTKLGLYVKICGIGVAATLIATIIHFFV